MEEKAEMLAASEAVREEKLAALRQARKDLENCEVIYSDENPKCRALYSEWNEIKAEARMVFNNYSEISEKSSVAKYDFNRLSAQMKELMNRYNESVSPLYDMLGRLAELKIMVMGLYEEYGLLEGAKAQVTWSIGWDKLLDDFKRLNPELKVTWKQLPIKEAELVASANSLENTLI
jgi:DNA repair ATPase RecN